MSENTHQNVYGVNESNAILLLEAAQKLDLDPSVVQTTTSGYFVVPVEVADKAGFDETGRASAKKAQAAAKTEQEKADALEAARQADAAEAAAAADALRATTSGDPDGPADANAETDESDAELKGEALAQALKDRGLPATGSADEKRAAVAEYDAKNGS